MMHGQIHSKNEIDSLR